MTDARQKHKGGHAPRLTVTVRGPNVGDARLSAADLAEVVKGAQQALKRVGRVLYGQESTRPGRDKADIEQLCELFLVAWERGSAVAQLELGQPPAQMHLFGYIGQESLKAFVNGMPKIQDAAVTPGNLPHGFDRGVLQTCDALARVTMGSGWNQMAVPLQARAHGPVARGVDENSSRGRPGNRRGEQGTDS